jgi:hypothetical protein
MLCPAQVLGDATEPAVDPLFIAPRARPTAPCATLLLGIHETQPINPLRAVRMC